MGDLIAVHGENNVIEIEIYLNDQMPK